MKDFIRSPLEFVRPMTETEWQELVLRESHREQQRDKRRRPKRSTPVESKPSRRVNMRSGHQQVGSQRFI